MVRVAGMCSVILPSSSGKPVQKPDKSTAEARHTCIPNQLPKMISVESKHCCLYLCGIFLADNFLPDWESKSKGLVEKNKVLLVLLSSISLPSFIS